MLIAQLKSIKTGKSTTPKLDTLADRKRRATCAVFTTISKNGKYVVVFITDKGHRNQGSITCRLFRSEAEMSGGEYGMVINTKTSEGFVINRAIRSAKSLSREEALFIGVQQQMECERTSKLSHSIASYTGKQAPGHN